MRSLKVVIIDDEKNAVESIVTVLNNYCKNVEICGIAYNAASGLIIAKKEMPDLVFVDIEMPDATGFDVANGLKNSPALIVFVTAFEQYAVKAFKANAVDYILKPINIDEILAVVEKACKICEQRDKYEQSSDPITSFSEKISLPTGKGLLFIDINNILYVKADGRYSTFYITNHEPVYVSKSLGEIEEMLNPGDFFRSHHSSLVNLHHVLSLNTKEGGFLEMRNGAKVALSRRRKEDFLKAFGVKKE